jgi:hypothetical protein
LELDPATLRSQQEVRAPIVAMKPVKADGAKGGRKANPRKPNVMKKKSNRPKPGMNIPGQNLYLLKWDIPRLTEEAHDDLFASRNAVKFTWVETSVWTPKMCSTLERGIKGGKHLLCRAWTIESARIQGN